MEPIAIVGMACRFPGAESPESYWRLLREGVDAVREVPADRWDFRRFPDASRWGGFLDRVDAFDPSFFGISPREAAYMDPQQRLLLEVAWEALEDAGLPLDRCAGQPVGVFVGISTYDYGTLQMSSPERISDGYANTGSALSIAANRISYLFDWRGPSMAVDTACSSSLTAAHLACQSLWRGESEVALAGGVNLILSPAITVGFSKLKAMASDGRCKSFDARADGYVRGEGAGIVVLKPLARAVADGDRIYALVRGTALNQDGRTNGLTAPNGLSQEALVREALAVAGVEPSRIGYVEAHGTGTPLGDPIELNALGTVLGHGRASAPRCSVGSVKTNIGHLEAAAGVAGLIKLALVLHHREIPPSLHFREPNPHIPFDTLPLEVQRMFAPWPEEMRPAVGGVSSFGFGGTNVHMVLEEPPAAAGSSARDEGPEAGVAERAYLLPLSAKSPEALSALVGAYRAALEPAAPPGGISNASLADLGYAASRRRTHHEHRLSVVARSRGELGEHLAAFLAGEARPGLSNGRATHGRRRKVAFVFPGQGAQWFGMARGLMKREPVFAASLETCAAAIREQAGWSLVDELHADAAQSRLGAVDVIQPALFAIQVSLAALWRSWGVEPDAVVGHSMGEVAAAHVAGALSLEDAATVICRRSRLLRKTSGKGAMAAVELSIEQAERALAGYEDRVSIAVSNSPSSTVLSGDPVALEDIIKALEARSVFCRRVKVDVASHSPQMDPLRSDLLQVLYGVHSRPETVPLYSTVIGKASAALDLDAAYWVKNLREPVLFSLAVERLLADGHTVFVELSPHPILLPAVQQTLRHLGKEGTVLPSLRREEDEQAVMLGSLGALFDLGRPVRWDVVNPAGRPVRLPSYPWQRDRFWLEETRKKKDRSASGHPLLGTHVRSAADGTHFWDVELGTEAIPWLADHRVQGSVVLPAAAYLEMALAAAHEALGPGPHVVQAVRFEKALVIPDAGEERVQLVMTPGGGGAASFQFLGVRTGPVGAAPPVRHAAGTIRSAVAADETRPATLASRSEIQARCPEAVSAAAHYEGMRRRGLDYGPRFRAVQQISRRDGEAIARLRLSPEEAGAAASYRVHPALLDACLQVLAAALPASGEGSGLYLPVGLGSLSLDGDLSAEPARWGHAQVHDHSEEGGAALEGDVFLLDESGKAALSVRGLRLKRLAADAGAAGQARDEWFYEVRWQPAPLPPPAAGRRPAAGRWIVFIDEHGVGDTLRPLLEARGDACVTVSRGKDYDAAGDGRYRLDPARLDHFRQLLRDALGNGAHCRGVVHLWSLDAPREADTTLASLETARDEACLSVLHTVQALALTGRRDKPRLWLVTRGAQAVEAADPPAALGPALVWGLARTITHEHPELGCTSVDLGGESPSEEARALVDEICADDREEQVALRGPVRHVARLARFSPEDAPRGPAPSTTGGDRSAPGTRSYRLETSAPGVLENLSLRAIERRAPGAGQVEIRVETAGLNFRDVLLALGLLPGLPDGTVPLGFECAGVVTTVGEGVERPRPGDEVVAISAHSLSSTVVTEAAFVAPRPAGLGFDEAATLPVAFLTAYYALNHLARLAPGERVLIHSASGGVGLAAVQIARQIGAEVYATAGNPEKRDLLHSLGIERVSDSRSLAFADEVMAWTGGEGVDVVLNSLAGAAIARGMALLRPGGRFLELGKRDILQNSPLGLQLLENNRSLFAIDLNGLSRDRPAFFASMLSETMRYFGDHALQALPVRVFPASEMESAFRHLAQGKHVGKVVVSMRDPAVTVRPAARATGLRAEGTYLVTGGLGGLGLAVARWMVGQGARSLVLVGRSAASREAQAAVDAMEKAGARVVVARADVADPRQVADVLRGIDESVPPLRGVIHAAGVLDDGILLQMDAARLRSVMAPKVSGGWNLHVLTSGKALDFFILFSSAAGVLGSPGQGNYAAASAFLDALAHHRQSRGLPALSIDWGPWSEVGLAARPDRGGRLAAQGMESLSPPQGVAALARLVGTGAAQVSVIPVNWGEWREVHRAAAGAPLLADLGREEAAPTEEESPRDRVPAGAAILAAPPADRQRVVEAHLQREVARVLGLSVSKLDVNQPLSSLGIDSLMAVELKNRIESDLQLSVPLIKVIQGPSVAELAALLLGQLAGVDPLAEAPVPPPAPARGKGDSLLLSILALGEDERKG
jgi:acyl transferase domain-containing protein/acyl carrier protein